MIETNIVWYESCGLADVRRMDGSTSQITREQQILLNFDEIIVICYFGLALWYAYYKHLNSRSLAEELSSRGSGHSTRIQHEFTPIHWFILAIAVMGLANFLLSFSLLEVLDHRSSIGSTVLKLSYVNMIFACLRHPCTLSLGVLAPKVAFGYDRYYYFPSESAARSESTKNRTICLAALVCAQLVLRLMESVMTLFCFGGSRNSEIVKLADLFEYLLDGVFLSQMAQAMHKIIAEVSQDRGGVFAFDRWQVWWKSRRLLHFLMLYMFFVTVSTVLILLGISSFFGASFMRDEHSVYTVYKAHAINDLMLLAGVATLLRPKPVRASQRVESTGLDRIEDPEIDYHLLRSGSNEEESESHEADHGHEAEEVEIAYEMTSASSTPCRHESHSILTTGL